MNNISIKPTALFLCVSLSFSTGCYNNSENASIKEENIKVASEQLSDEASALNENHLVKIKSQKSVVDSDLSIETEEYKKADQIALPTPRAPITKDKAKKEAIIGQYRASGLVAKSPMISRNAVLSKSYIAPPVHLVTPQEKNTENYLNYQENAIQLVSEKPLSTLSIDVDTASYSNTRRLLMQGKLPPKDAVKTEELINYFNYSYQTAKNLDSPFSVTTEIAPSPWNDNKKLLHVGIKGYDIDKANLPDANLVFLVDVSGSMKRPEKLGLVKQSLKLLVNQLDENDKISLVVYAGAAGVVLEPTSITKKHKIIQAIDNLQAGGSTNGEAGILAAYNMAEQGRSKDSINRIIICSDGDMNVGKTSISALKQLIEQKRKSGVALTTLGFGSGNYNYALMEQLADVGNGNAAYIDNLLEAQKVLVNEMSSTLLTIAKDVKIQIEFSPLVKEYRLIGYENRLLKREDFNNDKVDAGEIGAGHTVTAIYEIALAENANSSSIDPLRYQNNKKQEVNDETNNYNNELAFVKIRYKEPNEDKSKLITHIVNKQNMLSSINQTSDNYRFSASVAAFAQKLRNSSYIKLSYQDIISLAQQAKGKDDYGYRAEFIKLAQLAKDLSN
ncbi:MAG: VWA domain-containing protein [Gammaproteobacteria bacterium]|nr:VWA domain-containing protein [Gammaproteobacteria bacterium]